MTPKTRLSPKKILKLFILTVSIILLLLGITGYIVIKSYLGKINMVSSSENAPQNQSNGSKSTRQDDTNSIEENNNKEVASNEKNMDGEKNSDILDSSKEDIAALEEAIRANIQENSTPIMKDKSVLNILLIGTDSRQIDGSGRSDAMILVSINKETKKIIATSLLRDIYLRIPGEGSNRINASYAYGGADLLMQTIEDNFKIEIDRYVSIDFFAFMDVVNAVGGVTLEVTQEEIPVINNYVKELNQLTNVAEEQGLLIQGGTLLLNGKQALGYARNRYIGYADFERTARQRKVLEQLYNHVKDLGLLKLNKLLNIVLPQITTNLTEGELFSLILSAPTYTKYDLVQWSVPLENTYTFMTINHMSVLGVDFHKNIEEINKRIYNQ